MARPKRFELLTLRFVVWGQALCPMEADRITTSSADRLHTRSGSILDTWAPGSSKSQRPALAHGLCEVGHAPSRRMAEAGFKDSAVKKLPVS
jgi:hypothetical protein